MENPDSPSPAPPDSVVGRFQRLWEWLVAALVMALAAVTGFDVVARFAFNAPLRGGSFIVAVLMAATIFAALPLATARDEHLRAGLLDHLFRGRARSAQFWLIWAVSLAAFSGLTYVLWRQGVVYGRTGAEIPSIRVPLAAVAYGGAALTAAAAVLVLAAGLRRPAPLPV